MVHITHAQCGLVVLIGRLILLVGIYGEPKGTLLSLVEGHQGGLTHLIFSQDGHRLYSGGRKVMCFLINRKQHNLRIF